MSTPVTGRRAAARQRPRLDAGAVAGLVLVVLAGGLLAAAGLAQAEPEPPARPSTVTVDQVTTACLGSPERPDSRVSTVTVPLPEGAEAAAQGAGKGTLAAGPPEQEPGPRAAGARGRLHGLDAPDAGAALAVEATGEAALGRITAQADTADAGLADQECLAPRARWWFTGGGAGLDHRSKLVMANVDPGPAVVDVMVHGPAGLADDVGTRGITLAPGEVRTVDLVDVAPQSDELAVHVEASRGRVVAALDDGFATAPAADPGREWVPAQPDAAHVLRLSPLPSRADRRTLVVANPSDREALVEVKVAGETGSFVPTDVGEVRVPAESLVTVDLSRAVGRETSAVVLRSPVPVTATLRSSQGSDVAYAAAAPVLDGPAAAVIGDGTTPEVQLTAGPDGAKATVTAYSAAGDEVDSAALEVKPATTLGWSPKGDAAYVVVDPVRGVLSGGVSLEGGAGLTQVVLRPLPILLEQPAVVPVVR
jgi:hypothetical protein